LARKAKRKGRWGRGCIHYYDVCLPEQSLHVLKPCCPGSGWISPADGK